MEIIAQSLYCKVELGVVGVDEALCLLNGFPCGVGSLLADEGSNTNTAGKASLTQIFGRIEIGYLDRVGEVLAKNVLRLDVRSASQRKKAGKKL